MTASSAISLRTRFLVAVALPVIALVGIAAWVVADRPGGDDTAVAIAAVAGGAVLLTIGVGLVVLRPALRSLRTLTTAANDVAGRRLPALVDALRRDGEPTELVAPPAPITVRSHDELGDLADAFNAIQQTAVDVAREQREVLRKGIGELYVNLARRNQSLLERQLALIDALETDERDADQLASLFQLDHLATRMRRNAESLLVLAGVEITRVDEAPQRLVDVVRAASAEIPDYARIDVVGVDDRVTLTGSDAVDLTHVLAELLENATSFSAPTTRVSVRGAATDDGYHLSVVDEGIGITGERVTELNDLLARPPLPGLRVSRSLGLVVVSHLAARAGATVALTSAPGLGTTALLAMPATRLQVDPTAGHPLVAGPAVLPQRSDAPAAHQEVALAPRSAPPAPTRSNAQRAAAMAAAMEDLRPRDGGPASREPVGARSADGPRMPEAPRRNGAADRSTSTLPRRSPVQPLDEPPADAPRGPAPRRPDAALELLARFDAGRRRAEAARRAPQSEQSPPGGAS